MSIPRTLAPPVATPLEIWRAAHRAAVRHLIGASYGECDCSADRPCDVGQILDDAADDAERRLTWRMKA